MTGGADGAEGGGGVSVVALNTMRGSVEVEVAPGSARCITKGCKTLGGGLAQVTVRRVSEQDFRVALCGNCMAQAMALVVSGDLPELVAALRATEQRA